MAVVRQTDGRKPFFETPCGTSLLLFGPDVQCFTWRSVNEGPPALWHIQWPVPDDVRDGFAIDGCPGAARFFSLATELMADGLEWW